MFQNILSTFRKNLYLQILFLIIIINLLYIIWGYLTKKEAIITIKEKKILIFHVVVIHIQTII